MSALFELLFKAGILDDTVLFDMLQLESAVSPA